MYVYLSYLLSTWSSISVWKEAQNHFISLVKDSLNLTKALSRSSRMINKCMTPQCYSTGKTQFSLALVRSKAQIHFGIGQVPRSVVWPLWELEKMPVGRISWCCMNSYIFMCLEDSATAVLSISCMTLFSLCPALLL